jgi:hypothetical protein
MKWAKAFDPVADICRVGLSPVFAGFENYGAFNLGLTPQALCLHLLRRFLCKPLHAYDALVSFAGCLHFEGGAEL